MGRFRTTRDSKQTSGRNTVQEPAGGGSSGTVDETTLGEWYGKTYDDMIKDINSQMPFSIPQDQVSENRDDIIRIAIENASARVDKSLTKESSMHSVPLDILGPTYKNAVEVKDMASDLPITEDMLQVQLPGFTKTEIKTAQEQTINQATSLVGEVFDTCPDGEVMTPDGCMPKQELVESGGLPGETSPSVSTLAEYIVGLEAEKRGTEVSTKLRKETQPIIAIVAKEIGANSVHTGIGNFNKNRVKEEWAKARREVEDSGMKRILLLGGVSVAGALAANEVLNK